MATPATGNGGFGLTCGKLRAMDSVSINRAPPLTLWTAVVAESREPEALADEAFRLYDAFRPEVPAAERGWGATRTPSLKNIAQLARQRRPS